jgi:hypothetical protein
MKGRGDVTIEHADYYFFHRSTTLFQSLSPPSDSSLAPMTDVCAECHGNQTQDSPYMVDVRSDLSKRWLSCELCQRVSYHQEWYVYYCWSNILRPLVSLSHQRCLPLQLGSCARLCSAIRYRSYVPHFPCHDGHDFNDGKGGRIRQLFFCVVHFVCVARLARVSRVPQISHGAHSHARGGVALSSLRAQIASRLHLLGGAGPRRTF